MIADVNARLDGDGGSGASGAVHDAAARGVSAPATALPHADQIRASFGGHDVSGVKAHVGGGAADACATMGATAYASGDHVAFAGQPDLHTAAHEAAHVVQQARGVNLYGGVGQVDDAYERHADAVADAVVDGRSAAPLLDGGPAGGGGAGAVQRKTAFKDTGSKRVGGGLGGKEHQLSLRLEHDPNEYAFTDSVHMHEFITHVVATSKDDIDTLDLAGAYQAFILTSPAKVGVVPETPKEGHGEGVNNAPMVEVKPEIKPVEVKPEVKPEVQPVVEDKPVEKAVEVKPEVQPVDKPVEVKPPTPAETWKKWADDNAGGGHTFVEGTGGLLVVNGAIDCVPNLLEELSANTEALKGPPVPEDGKKAPVDPYEGHTWTSALHGLLEATAAQTAGNIVPYQKAVLTKLSSSKGGRLRFRFQIGPSERSDSTVDLFIAGVLLPAYGNKLPDFLEDRNLSPMSRKRLYDMPNARSHEANAPAIKWAIEQKAATASQLVNFGEYYLASKDNIAAAANSEGYKQFLEQKDDIKVEKKDTEAEALRLAKERLKKGIDKSYGPLIGLVSKAAKLSDIVDPNGALLQELLGAAYNDLSGKDLTTDKNKTRGEIRELVKTKIAAKVATEQLTATPDESEETAATASAQKRMEAELLKQLTDEARVELTNSFEKDVVKGLADERKVVREAGYAPGGNGIAGFWEKDPGEQIKALQSRATEGPIPFTSDDSGAYHSLKHYMDIRSTEDAKAGGSNLESYLISSRKTVEGPESTDTQISQFSSHPAFFFFRTVPFKDKKDAKAKVEGEVEAEDQGVKGVTMRAIVIVTDDGKPMIATYFRA